MSDAAFYSPGLPELCDLIAPSAKGARGKTLSAAYVRDLDKSDMPALLAPPPKGSLVPVLKRIAYRHHQLAQVLASGRTTEEASAITGYAPGTIYTLKLDPTFVELCAHYAARKEALFLEYTERLGHLGASAADELQHRIDDNPGQFQSETLRKIMESAFDRSGKVAAAGGKLAAGPAAPVNVKVTFVNHQPSSDIETLTIDAETIP